MEQQTELRGKFPWTTEEDGRLSDYVIKNGARNWDAMARVLGIGRSGNSCRLRWVNYLSPDIRRGDFTDEEILKILNLHKEFGNRWARIAEKLSGRTDNRIKNFWNTRLKKEAKRLNCDVESEEFRQMMNARLRGNSQASLTTPADPGGNTLAASFSTGPSSHVKDLPADEELMSAIDTLFNAEQDQCTSDEFCARLNADHDCSNDEYWARLGFYLDYL